jgi:hypothetical protein
MKLKKCGCRACRVGLHRPNGGGKAIAKRAVRHGRRLLRDMLRTAKTISDYDNIPEKITLPYTD